MCSNLLTEPPSADPSRIRRRDLRIHGQVRVQHGTHRAQDESQRRAKDPHSDSDRCRKNQIVGFYNSRPREQRFVSSNDNNNKIQHEPQHPKNEDSLESLKYYVWNVIFLI